MFCIFWISIPFFNPSISLTTRPWPTRGDCVASWNLHSCAWRALCLLMWPGLLGFGSSHDSVEFSARVLDSEYIVGFTIIYYCKIEFWKTMALKLAELIQATISTEPLFDLNGRRTMFLRQISQCWMMDWMEKGKQPNYHFDHETFVGCTQRTDIECFFFNNRKTNEDTWDSKGFTGVAKATTAGMR